MWRWTFCEEWKILGGIVESQEHLAKWASLLYQTRKDEDPRKVAQEEFAQTAGPS